MKPGHKRKHRSVQHESREEAKAAPAPHVRFVWSALANAMVPTCARSRGGNFPQIIELAERVRARRDHVSPGSDLRDWLDAQQECEHAG